MKIKNEYIKIKNGKTYEFRNTITTDYLKLFSKSQYDEDYKLKANEKKLKYVYIKTGSNTQESKENNNKNYYNLIDVHNPISKHNSFSYMDFDWVKFTGKNLSEYNEYLFKLENTGFIQKGDSYRILVELRDIVRPQSKVATLRLAEKEFYIHINPANYQNLLSVNARYGNTIGVEENADGKYLFALHRHNYGKYDSEADIFTQIFAGVPTGVTFDFRISLIKEENNQDFVEQLDYEDYTYNSFVNFSSLASEYNYKLPANQSYYESSNARVDTYYTFDNASGFLKSDGTEFVETINVNEIANQKILQLAFGNEDTIFAFVDISDTNIVIEDDESLYIYRKDVITSDATFSGDTIPVHLSPLGYKINDTTYYAELYSVGLGFFKGQMNEEYLLSENTFEEIDDTTFRVVLEKGIDDTLTPTEMLQPHTELMPVVETHVGTEIHPNSNLQPNLNIYPCVLNYKYIMYKYRLYEIKAIGIYPIEKYYIMNFYTDNKGTTRVDTKYERS